MCAETAASVASQVERENAQAMEERAARKHGNRCVCRMPHTCLPHATEVSPICDRCVSHGRERAARKHCVCCATRRALIRVCVCVCVCVCVRQEKYEWGSKG